MSASSVQPSRGTTRSGRNSLMMAATRSVVPTGEVLSTITQAPGRILGAMARAAAST
jgi:hypothetical protein